MKTVHQYISTSVHQYISSLVLLAMLCSGTLYGQAGKLVFEAPTYNSLTGYTSVGVNWEDITISSSKGLYISIGISGTSICIDPTYSSVHPDFTNYVTHTNSSIIINRLSFQQPFVVQGDHLPLLTVYFKSAPGSTVTLTITVGSMFDDLPSPGFYQINKPNALNVLMPDPINIKGLVRKAPSAFSECINGLNGGISDVTMTYSAGTVTCFPSYNAYSTFSGFPSNPYTEVLPTGAYTVDVPSHYVYTITPYKTGDCDCGIGAEDINRGREIILYPETSMPTLAELIATDFDNDGTAITSDLVNMQKCLLGTYNPTTSWVPWFFVPITVYNANNPPNNVPYLPSLTSSITTSLITIPLIAQDFYGIKLGDIDGSCSDCDDEFFRAPEATVDRSVPKVINYHVEKPDMVKGQTADWYLTLDEDVDQLAVLGLDFDLNNQAVEILDIQAADISAEFFQSNISVRNGEAPLRLKWFSGDQDGESLNKGQSLVRLRVMALQNEAEAGTVLREIKYAKPNGFYENGANAAFIQLTVANSEAFELHLLGENPVQDQATFELSSPVETDVRLQLVDAQGQVVQTMLIQSNRGGQIVKLNSVENLKPGVYLLNAASQTQYTSVRFIKL